MRSENHSGRVAAEPPTALTESDLDALRRYDTCKLANAIETFQSRLRNQGYARPGLRCMFPEFPPVIGYAVSSRVRSINPSMTGDPYYERTDWWATMDRYPKPKIVVIQDLDHPAGMGAVAGEIHSEILKTLGCAGLVTNGAVRDLPAVRRMGFPMFAPHVSPSHAYTHMIDFDRPVEIFGLQIAPGDVLCGDCHGVISIPKSIVRELPAVLARLDRHERSVIDLCRSAEFSLDRLRAEVKKLA